jgi:hypothetical protein
MCMMLQAECASSHGSQNEGQGRCSDRKSDEVGLRNLFRRSYLTHLDTVDAVNCVVARLYVGEVVGNSII